ncbi:Spore germination protein B1 [compost metagenome]
MIKIPNTKVRDIDTPDTEQTVSGGKQAFVENLKININILRNLIRNPGLEIKTLNIGIRTKSPVSLIYLNGIINEDLPKEILKRLNSINVDGVVDTSQIQALIQEHKWTIFPQLLTTERVDRTISEILNGKAIILLEGSPFALVLPTTLNSFLNSQDDIYGRSIITSILRIIRYIGFFEACSISALYLALTTYHPGLLPTSLALSITGTRVGLPFPVYIEILLMEITLYLVQEAALRLPKSVGNTVGIVGGLVIGQSVVLAGIISPIIVVIVSMSAVSSFTLPNYNLALSTIAIRLFLIFCSMTLGLYGFVIGVVIILIHLASLDNFGVKYLADYSPYNKNILKENLIRAPLSTIHKRPKYLNPKDYNK